MSTDLAIDSGRRRFLIAAAVMFPCASAPVSFFARFGTVALAQESGIAAGIYSLPSSTALDTWIELTGDGYVQVYFGKVDVGQGLDTAIAQMVSDELQVDFSRLRVVMGDTAQTPDQGGASSASGVESGARPLLGAAAEARRILLAMAAMQLSQPVDTLYVIDGVIRSRAQSDAQVSYWQLLGARPFAATLHSSGRGNSLDAWGEAPVRTQLANSVLPDAFVGRSMVRHDIAQKVYGRFAFIDKVSVPDMLHARMLRPPKAGAVPVAVEASALAVLGAVGRDIFVVHQGDLLAVAANTEWLAIRAAEQLQVTWSVVPAPFPGAQSLYAHIRAAPPRFERNMLDEGDVAGVFAGSVSGVETVLSAEYEWPFQSHASMGPACAVADVRTTHEGMTAVVWTGSQKPHAVREGIAALLGLPAEQVRAIWVAGPGSYGRNDADDAAADAAVLSRALGRPVRVQYMRHEGLAWDPKGPAAVMQARAAIGVQGDIVALDWMAKGFSAHDVRPSGADPGDLLAGHLLGVTRENHDNFGAPQDSYAFAHKRLRWQTIEPLLRMASPLRTSHIRDPQGPQTTFSSECFLDEIAAHLHTDPVQLRLRYLRAPRDIAAVRAAAQRAQWVTRVSPNPQAGTGELRSGRGMAYCQRGRQTIVAIVCEVEVNVRTGRVWAKRFVVAHDCGRVINPEGLRNTIEGAVMQATSRTLYEEVQFDTQAVTSVDWFTYPILDSTDTPAQFDIVLLDDPAAPPLGAGEAAHKPVAAAIANAVFDATGVRFRRVPLTPSRILAGLNAR